MRSLDEAATPEDVVRMLRDAAQRYRESVSELAAMWQDPGAGEVWGPIAQALETCAKRCEIIISRY